MATTTVTASGTTATGDPNAEIAVLEAEAASLREELRGIKDRIHEIKCKAAGLRLGDLVRAHGDVYRVVEIQSQWWPQKLWVRGVARTRGGNWSKNPRHLYDKWEKVETEATGESAP